MFQVKRVSFTNPHKFMHAKPFWNWKKTAGHLLTKPNIHVCLHYNHNESKQEKQMNTLLTITYKRGKDSFPFLLWTLALTLTRRAIQLVLGLVNVCFSPSRAHCDQCGHRYEYSRSRADMWVQPDSEWYPTRSWTRVAASHYYAAQSLSHQRHLAGDLSDDNGELSPLVRPCR